MASKRRNMFHKNKTQETTEEGMVLGRVYERKSEWPVNCGRMRYYRLWIYTCNWLLFVSVVGFCVVGCKVLVLDPRRQVVPSLGLAQPSFLYAYLALLCQSGLLQLVGCLGAHRLSERLLNAYWLLIFVLLIGDALLGVFWLFKFERIASELRPLLKQSLARYGTDSQFTVLWDGIQSQHRCCGVQGYHDFAQPNVTDIGVGVSSTTMPVELPASCCRERPTTVPSHRRDTLMGSTPPSFTEAAAATAVATAAAAAASLGGHQPSSRPQLTCKSGGLAYTSPCHSVILSWLTQTAHVLFVVGYCVIAFIKLCFLGILRYEIREMIQKIKLVQEANGSSGDLDVAKLSKQNNGTILQAPQEQNSIGGRVGGGGGLVEGCDSPPMRRNPGRRHQVLLGSQDPGTDSDTNSHCALIFCEEGVKAVGVPGSREEAAAGTNGNNNYEMGELGRRCRT